MRSKMGCLEAFENGVPMLRGESAPFLKALEDKPQVCFLWTNLVRIMTSHRGKTRFFVLQVLASWPKIEEHFWTHKMKKNAPKLNTTAYIYIYTRPQQPVPFLAKNRKKKKQGKNRQKCPKKLSKRNGPPELESFFVFVFFWGRKRVWGACSQEFPQFWAVSL